MSDYPTNWNWQQLAVDDAEKALNEYVEKSRIFIDTWKNRTDYLTQPLILKKALDEYEIYAKAIAGGGKLAYLYWLKLDLDQNNAEIKAVVNKITETVTLIENEMRFFEHSLMEIGPEHQTRFLSDTCLENYWYYLERIFKVSRYELSLLEENILALKAKPAHSNWVQMTSELLAKEVIKGKTMEELLSLMRHKNKKKRDGAADLFNQLLVKFEDIAEIELNSIFEDKKINDRLRKTKRADELRLVGDDVDEVVIDTMLTTVAKHNQIAHSFYHLKAQLLGLPKLAYHERGITYGSIDKKYTFKNAVGLVGELFGNLDPEFKSIFDDFLQNGLVDVYPKTGKRGGAFCMGFLKTLPSYILLNWTNTLHDVTTLAHEMGHGINNELMRSKQHSLYWHTPVSTAEVASTFFEDFVLEKLLKTADEETRLAILMSKLDGDISSIFRQVACYQFEQSLHLTFREKGYVSKEEIGTLFQEKMRGYMGKAVEQSKGSQNWWIYWSHIRNFFYVYSYASGQLISKSLQNSVKNDPNFIEKVKVFLAAGTSDSPKNIFAKMGIDLEASAFWEQGLREIEGMLKEAEGLAKKLGKIGGP